MSDARLITAPPAEARSAQIIIVGSGFAGIGLGSQLRRHGRGDFVILERAGDVGGTWRDNHYPGIACNVPSHQYSLSWLLNPDWSRVYSPGPEIYHYLRKCAHDEGLLPHLRFNTEMLDARWDGARRLWVVATSQGSYEAPILITATGHLADGHLPQIDGLDSFGGTVFHSANWDHSAPLAGKRIGVVGSGASAIQIVPEVQKVAGELVVFQRNAPYIMPRPDRPFSPAERRMFQRDPAVMREMRSEYFWLREFNFAARRIIPRFLNEAKALALGHLARQVPDPEMRARLTPNFELGCKRTLISNDWYPAVTAPNVTLETSALARIEAGRAVGASGRGYELDALIFATGFEAVRPPFARRVFGEEGISLDEHWDRGMQAYDSIAVHGFPNLFIVNGPNTGSGHNSAVYIIEAQVDYILGALDWRDAHGGAVLEARQEAEDAYTARIEAMSQGTVWLEGGCSSWYVDPRSGRLTLIWPDFMHTFREENAGFHPEGYAATSLPQTA